MIKLTDNEGNNYEFELTRFPDGTTQAWKITPEPTRMKVLEITWMFESEAEVVTICQLGTLLYKHFYCFPTLVMPYLVGGRQDKQVSNTSTFARDVLINLFVNSGFTKIKTYDAHSGSVYIQSQDPVELINVALPGHDLVCFPDKGAKERYSKLLPKDIPVIYGNKRRNQQTGAIEGLELELNGHDLRGTNILVFDDICDFGGTFIKLAKEFENLGQNSLSLAVSHGLFSGGLDIIYKSGYNHIYTTNSLLRNKEGKYFFSDHNDAKLTVIKVV